MVVPQRTMTLFHPWHISTNFGSQGENVELRTVSGIDGTRYLYRGRWHYDFLQLVQYSTYVQAQALHRH